VVVGLLYLCGDDDNGGGGGGLKWCGPKETCTALVIPAPIIAGGPC